jgi:hypothetical protein
MSPQLDMYVRFTTALANANWQEARQCVNDSFWASFEREEGVHIVGLSFEHFAREVERQRVAFPDLGQNITKFSVKEEGNILQAAYVMTVTFSGLLVGPNGTSLQGNGQKMMLHQADHVIFEYGFIESFVVQSRMTEVLSQMP